MICAYCGERRAVGRDHVVPKTIAKRLKLRKSRRNNPDFPQDLLATVPACLECNVRKSTRKLVPPSWEDKIPRLVELLPGPWRVWRGDPLEVAFREVHL